LFMPSSVLGATCCDRQSLLCSERNFLQGKFSHGRWEIFPKCRPWKLSIIHVPSSIVGAKRGGIIPVMLPDLQLNDHLRLRKPHPCGSYELTVVRLGAVIGLECKGCEHLVMLTRRELAKRMKTNLTQLEREIDPDPQGHQDL